MYTLDQVIKAFLQLAKSQKDPVISSYYETIVKYLRLEHKYMEAVLLARRPIYHYFMYALPMPGKEYFEFLYDRYSPVRFAVETFDSIEEIRQELNSSKK